MSLSPRADPDLSLLHHQLDDLTQDLTVSQLSDVADYLEDVACA